MYLIEFYILRRIFTLFASTFIVVTGILWIVQLLGRISFLTMSRQNFFEVIYFSTLFLPPVLPLVIPFAFVIAISSTFSTMNQDSELIIVSATGFPRSIFFRPILGFSFILSVFSFLVTNFIAPYARINIRHIMAHARAELVTLFLETNVFHTISNGIYLEIGERYLDGTMGQIFIIDQSISGIDIFYYAQKGIILDRPDTTLLLMYNGELQRRDYKSGVTSIISFDSYTFDLGDFFSNHKAIVLYPKDRFLIDLIAPNPEDSYYKRYPLQYKVELHKRLTSWLYPLLFALVTLTIFREPISFRQMRIPISLVSISFSLFLFWFGHFLIELAGNNSAWIPCIYIMPIFISVGMLFLLITNKNFKTSFFLKNMLCLLFNKERKIKKR